MQRAMRSFMEERVPKFNYEMQQGNLLSGGYLRTRFGSFYCLLSLHGAAGLAVDTIYELQ